MIDRIERAIAMQQAGDREVARQRLAELWAEIGATGDPLCRCWLAHCMADLQDDPREELIWDLRALAAADELTDERVKSQHSSLSLADFYPSLHLNLAEDYRRLDDLAKARDHLRWAQESVNVLPNAGYGATIRGGILRLAERIDLSQQRAQPGRLDATRGGPASEIRPQFADLDGSVPRSSTAEDC